MVHDDILKLSLDGSIDARQKASQDNPKAFRLQGKGTLNEKPFATDITGGPLSTSIPIDRIRSTSSIEAGDIRVAARARSTSLSTWVRARCRSAPAAATSRTCTTSPNSRCPTRRPTAWRCTSIATVEDSRQELEGKVGRSDLGGELLVDISRKRPSISGHLKSSGCAGRPGGASGK